MAWLQQHASRVFRLASVISLIAAITWFLWPQESWAVDPEALIAVLMAGGVWIWQEVVNFPSKRAHPHDVKLMSNVLATMGPNQLRFLKEHDLGGSFRDKDVNFLFEIADNWKGVRYEFDDKKMQKLFAEFVQATRKFAFRIAERNIPLARGRNSLVPDYERGSFFSAETSQAIEELNEEATNLATLYESFEKLARTRIPEAFRTK